MPISSAPARAPSKFAWSRPAKKPPSPGTCWRWLRDFILRGRKSRLIDLVCTQSVWISRPEKSTKARDLGRRARVAGKNRVDVWQLDRSCRGEAAAPAARPWFRLRTSPSRPSRFRALPSRWQKPRGQELVWMRPRTSTDVSAPLRQGNDQLSRPWNCPVQRCNHARRGRLAPSGCRGAFR